MRILRPWIVASVVGGGFGALLLALNRSEPELPYTELPPRAAVHDRPAPGGLDADPFAPASPPGSSPEAPMAEMAPASAAGAESPALVSP